jgi:hypothetical protein
VIGGRLGDQSDLPDGPNRPRDEVILTGLAVHAVFVFYAFA